MKIREIMYFWVLLTLVCVPTSALGSLCPGIVEEEVVLAEKYNKLPTCPARHISSALSSNARCRLHTTVVTLPWPNSTLVQQMTPTHVAVQRCAGGCHGVGQGCAALATRQKEVSVMVGKCGVSVGKCEKECATVTLEEHTKCDCGCHLDRLQCELDGLHKFRKELCQCECKDVEAKRSCLEQGRTWEEDSCTCGCPALKSCAPGSVYSATTCMCEPEEQSNDLLTKEDRAPRSNKSSIFSGEIIIIGVLLGLILIMLMIIFSLINKLQSVKRRIKLRRLTAEAQNNVDIYSELGKKDAMLKPKEQSYAQLYCDSPSSGFASRSGSAKYSEPEAESSPEPCQECLYQSAESVRVNKRLHSVPCPSPAMPSSQRTLDRRAAHQGGGGVVQPSPAGGQISQYGQLRVSGDGQGFSTAVTRQIDEAVRLLESSAAQL